MRLVPAPPAGTIGGGAAAVARRLRPKSSLDGLKTAKCRPADGVFCSLSLSGVALHANGLSSVLKSARCGIAVPFGYTVPSGPTTSCSSLELVWIDALWPNRPVRL